MKFEQITIIGVGLIGGSLGLAVKKKKLSDKVVGVTVHNYTLRKALRRKAIDEATLDAAKSVRGSDLVILSTPVGKILDILKKISPYLKKGCVVIDVASVKGAIVETAERIIGDRANFIGTHPMAGSEQRGIDKADSDLFKGSPCVLIRTKKTNADALRLISGFWGRTGATVHVLSIAEHDKKISNISHLPHVVASCLSSVMKPSSAKFASTGFKDTTRIASGDPALWTSILLANRVNIIRDIERYLRKLHNLKDKISGEKNQELKKFLIEAKKKRDSLLK